MTADRFRLHKAWLWIADRFRGQRSREKGQVAKTAFDRLSKELAQQCLRESTVLYSKVYQDQEEDE
jgi:hypothetical protein